MSKPATHSAVPSAKNQGGHPQAPPAANHPPTGATANAKPRNSCVYVVNRFASEYQKTIPRAIGDKAKQSGPSVQVTATNATEATATSVTASRMVIAPRGSSRLAVRGFFASYRTSTIRLKPIAAVRAVAIARTTPPIRPHVRGDEPAASSEPLSANGNANTVWLKRINDP